MAGMLAGTKPLRRKIVFIADSTAQAFAGLENLFHILDSQTGRLLVLLFS
jgi:hypothetical protein